MPKTNMLNILSAGQWEIKQHNHLTVCNTPRAIGKHHAVKPTCQKVINLGTITVVILLGNNYLNRSYILNYGFLTWGPWKWFMGFVKVI